MNDMPHPATPLLDHCPPSLPGNWYHDDAQFARERRDIWSRSWVYAGRLGDMPVMTLRRIEVAGQSLILVRESETRLACFHNTCRHRGSELCGPSEAKLKAKLITCPYHQWSYDLSGQLVRTPYVSETADFRKADHGLFAVPVHVWNGFVYVCLAEEPPDFAGVPDLGIDCFAHWPMSDLVTGHREVIDIACNWKIYWENFNECLHCPGIHPELCELVPVYGKGYMAPNEDPAWDGENATWSKLRAGARSWTTTGEPSGPEFPGLSEQERRAGQRFVTLLPTMYIVGHVDYVRAVSLKPLAPERTELMVEWLFAPETLAKPGFDPGTVADFARTVLRQDAQACEMNQRGLKSARFAHGVLTPQEYELHNFHNWVKRLLKGD